MTEKRDFRSSVFLPKTDFPMKAGLPQKEPGILKGWQDQDLYRRLRDARAGREKFILHDGPPYANGNIHVGHAVNHILKDMVVRTQSLLGKDAPYVPGWDCHGLPIEWKVEEEYRKKKKNKDEVPPKEFRAECRAYARQWVDAQREQLKRLGVNGDWDHPYLTMDFAAEGTIVSELLKFAESGQLYRGAKPVMWSPVEKTALAEAEVEYEDITSTQIDVAFEITESPIPELVGAYAVIWTTTPWTIPTNQALAYGADVDYVVMRPLGLKSQNESVFEHPAYKAITGKRYLVAYDLKDEFDRRATLAINARLKTDGIDAELIGFVADTQSIKGSDFAGTKARHPMADAFPDSEFLNRKRPFLDGSSFVTTESGTGLVHMAPDHGEDDFLLCKAHGIEPVFAVEADGRYREDWPWVGGLPNSVIDKKLNAPDGPICTALAEADALLSARNDESTKHSYPHSWRSKAKVIYRCTPQWFVPMDRVSAVRPTLTRVPADGDLVDAQLVLDYLPDGAIGYHRSLDYIVLHVGHDLHIVGEGFAQGYANRMGVPFQMAALIKGALLEGAEAVLDGTTVPLVQDDTITHDEGTGFSASGPTNTLRAKAVKAIADTRFVPDKGRNRIGAMVEGRPDWVLSRQRAWGVPITLFVDRKTGHYLVDPAVNARIIAAIHAEGVDAWEDARAQEYLGADYAAEDYERVADILDVWFDSGSTHAFVLESGRWPDLTRPAGYTGPKADLYLEGSDQHRGWFQSSLLESCATRGHAPYKAVLTHGFTMDAKGMKMSKSLGNTVDPLKVMETYGADIVRLWALSVDYTEDHRIGDEILKGIADQYRKLRNTFRYLLGALDGFSDAEKLPVEDMPELERYVLALLAKLDGELRVAVDAFDFNAYVRSLVDFCNEDLSAFFFDIRKDSLYCDAADAPKRRAYRTVLDILFHALIRYAAPVLVFTGEEVWKSRFPEADSVHLLEWPVVANVDDFGIFTVSWDFLRILRKNVLEAIEPLRREKLIGSGNEAEIAIGPVAIQVDAGEISAQNLGDVADLREIFISSKVSYSDEGGITVTRTTAHKCGRCWRHLPDVAEDGDLCARCEDVVAAKDSAL